MNPQVMQMIQSLMQGTMGQQQPQRPQGIPQGGGMPRPSMGGGGMPRPPMQSPAAGQGGGQMTPEMILKIIEMMIQNQGGGQQGRPANMGPQRPQPQQNPMNQARGPRNQQRPPIGGQMNPPGMNVQPRANLPQMGGGRPAMGGGQQRPQMRMGMR